MTSILYHSGLNYGATNPLRAELNVIRDSVTSLEKNFKDVVAGGAGVGSGAGARGVTAGLKEVALQIVTLRTEIEGLKTRMTAAEAAAAAEKKRLDGTLADLSSRMGLTEAAVGAAVNTVSSLNATVSSLIGGGTTAVVAENNNGIESVLITVSADEVADVEAAPVVAEETSAAPADEDEAASEEILAMLRSSTA
jgi:hypothetical protein